MRRVKNQKRRGAATAELAVLLPFLLFAAVIAADWARIMYFTITLDNCARRGALWASDTRTQAQTSYTNITDASLSEAPSLPATPTVTSTKTTDNGGYPAVKVTVTMTFKTIAHFDLRPVLPFNVPQSQTITRSVLMRIAPQYTN